MNLLTVCVLCMSSLYADQNVCGNVIKTLYCIFLLKIYSNHNMPCTETTHQRSHILPSAMSGILWSLPKTGLHYLVLLLQNSYQNLSFEMQMLKWEVVYFPLLTENTLHPYIHHWLIYIDSIEWRCWDVLWKQYDLKLKKKFRATGIGLLWHFILDTLRHIMCCLDDVV